MSKKESNSNPIQDSLRIMRQCPVCSGNNQPTEDNILRQQDNVQLMHFTCPQCNHSVIAVIVTSQIGLSSVGMVTDMTADDVLKLHHRDPINEDELLAWHKFLKVKHNITLLK